MGTDSASARVDSGFISTDVRFVPNSIEPKVSAYEESEAV